MIKLKKIISVLLISLICILTLNYNRVYAAGGVSLTASKTVYVGDTVVVTASVTAGAWNLTLSGNGQNKGLAGQTSTTGNASASTSITFTPTSVGTYTFTLSGDYTDYYASDATDVSKTCTITVIEKAKEPENNGGNNNSGNNSNGNNNSNGSGNNNNNSQTPTPGTNTNNIPQDAPAQSETKSRNYYLSSLSVKTSIGDIKLGQVGNESAGFNRGVENYVVIFPEDFNYDEFYSFTINATAEDSKSKITGTGSVSINEGDNNFEIKCTAENGSAKTYKIKVTKPVVIKDSELKLDSLQLEKINENGESEEIVFDEEFNPNTLSYSFDIESDITALSIKLAVSKVKDKDIIVKINGNEISRDLDGNLEEEQVNLEDGTNTIRITLVSPLDENVTTDYVITANKEPVIETIAGVSDDESSDNGDVSKIIIGVIVGIIIILLITLVVLLIINKKQKKQSKLTIKNNLQDDNQKLFDYDEEDTYLNDKSLEKLDKEYEEKINETANNDEIEDINEEVENSDKIKENEDNNIDEQYENLTNEDRQKKLDELISELKDKNKGKK